MTRPITASKVLLVADRRAPSQSRQTVPVRRYRLARLRFDSRPAGSESRFDYLKRVYD
ncbi:MAG TPA: hypothetical protein VMA77_07730 [Solirubrobacteraceae bacterium]|nr:hypothetical protein [Solirubrobacteraceae bacterium]